MKATLMKDWLSIQSLLRNYLMIIVMYLIIAFINQNVYLFSGMMMIIPMLLTINTLGYDERANTVRYLIASGVPRKTLAISKYVFALLLNVVGIVVNVVFLGIFEGFVVALLASLGYCLVSMTYVSLLLPIMFKLGVEKARIYMMLGIVVPLLMLSFLSGLEGISMVSPSLLVGGGIVICVAIIVGSIVCSVNIMNHKDF